MKAGDLAKLLLEHPDFEVNAIYADTANCNQEHVWPDYHSCTVTGIADIGHSSQVIVLDLTKND